MYLGRKITMDKNYEEKIGLFRYQIISPILNSIDEEDKTLHQLFLMAANRNYENPFGEKVKISEGTIERWYYRYKKHGFDALKPKRRSDSGKSRKIDDDLLQRITYIIESYPRLPATLIRQKLIDDGIITPKEISLSTINRCVNQIKKEKKLTNNRDMKRYEREHINEVWCGDSSVGPTLKVNGQKKRTYIIALIDDASRMITGIDIYFNDNSINLMKVIKSGIKQFGKPSLFNFDNGATYKNTQITLLSARVGFGIHYCNPYDPVAKAKIERWFNTMKRRWMAGLAISANTTIEDLRASLKEYVHEYNHTVHSSIKDTPHERFFNESHLIKYLKEDDYDEKFLLEVERKVSPDSVVNINNLEYEVPYRFASQRVTIRYSSDFENVYVIDSTGELIEIKLLNKHENANIKREKIKFTGGTDELS